MNEIGSTTTTFIERQIGGLCKDHEVIVVCSKYRGNLTLDKPLTIRVIPYEPNIWVQRVRRRLSWYNVSMGFRNRHFSQLLNRIVADFNPDVIHCQFGPDSLKLIDNLEYRKNEIPIFIQFRGYDASMMLQESPVYVRRMRKLFQKRNIHPIFVAEYLYKNLLNYGATPDKKRVLYSCTDLTFFQRSLYAEERTVFHFAQISSLTEKKGHQYTIDAFARFKKHYPNIPWRLSIAGNGPLYVELNQQVENLGLAAEVKFLKDITPIQAKRLLEESHFFVHHSVTDRYGSTEGIPNAVMEAMAMELPILSTLHAGIPELVENGIHGFLVPEKDVAQYSQKIFEILPWGYQRHNRDKIRSKFELANHLKTLLSFYKAEYNE